MKKVVLFTVLCLMITVSGAQELGPSAPHPWSGSGLSGDSHRTGNVGIGTTTPSEALEVNGNVLSKKGRFDSQLSNGSFFFDTADRNRTCNVLRAGYELSDRGSLFNFLDFPESNLNTQAQSFLGIEDRNYKSRFRYLANTGGSSEQSYYDKNQIEVYNFSEDGFGLVHLQLPAVNSHLSIGTDSFQDGLDIYHLSVNGKVRAESVKVYTDWADFVFESDYNLPTLQEVETHIKEKGHLKDIPSAKEVEENGIDVGEMNKLLLQKVEELTLYLIEKDKEVKALTMKVDQLIETQD